MSSNERLLPSREIVLWKINALRDSTESREEVSAWAVSSLDDRAVEVTDREVWRVLKWLGAADLPSTDRDYLYGDDDFADWAAKLM